LGICEAVRCHPEVIRARTLGLAKNIGVTETGRRLRDDVAERGCLGISLGHSLHRLNAMTIGARGVRHQVAISRRRRSNETSFLDILADRPANFCPRNDISQLSSDKQSLENGYYPSSTCELTLSRSLFSRPAIQSMVAIFSKWALVVTSNQGLRLQKFVLINRRAAAILLGIDGSRC